MWMDGEGTLTVGGHDSIAAGLEPRPVLALRIHTLAQDSSQTKLRQAGAGMHTSYTANMYRTFTTRALNAQNIQSH